MNVLKKFFPSKKKVDGVDEIGLQAITLTPVYRKRSMNEENRKAYATELLDTYYGFGSAYLAGYIKSSITNLNIQREMLKVIRCMPLLKFFVNSVSRVYSEQPNRKFMLDGKEIIKKPVVKKKSKTDNKSTDPTPFDATLNTDKFEYDDELYDALNNLYNDNVKNSIKQAEKFTNLLNTCIYKVVTDDDKKIKILFIPNDTVQVLFREDDVTAASQIAFVKDVQQSSTAQQVLIPIMEIWNKEVKKIDDTTLSYNTEGSTPNEAAIEYEKLFGHKNAGSAFAPFVVFRDSSDAINFWDLKDNDVIGYIRTINMSLTELKYLEKFTSFGLKYTVNIKHPDNGIIDPNGFLDLAVANNSVPGMDNSKNFEIGEFKNEGRIEDVIKSIIFNIKMLFSLYSIPLDPLISSNSIRSAESKEKDNEQIFKIINDSRDNWNKNEQELFKVMQAVHNRDNTYQIKPGIEMIVDYEEKTSVQKTVEDWMVEIENDVSTVIDWLSDKNPDLDRDELMDLFNSNIAINMMNQPDPLDPDGFYAKGEQTKESTKKTPQDNNGR